MLTFHKTLILEYFQLSSINVHVNFVLLYITANEINISVYYYIDMINLPNVIDKVIYDTIT